MRQEYPYSGPLSHWLYGIGIGLALFSGFGQMPIYKRYYLTDIPGLGWAADFYTTASLHYLAVALVLGLLAWRIGLYLRGVRIRWLWGPGTAWGWILFALLAVSGLMKVLRNLGLYLPPAFIVTIDLVHMGSAMALMFTGLGVILSRRRRREKTL